MGCSCEHPLVHGDCAVPETPRMVIYQRPRRAGAPRVEVARFDDESLDFIDLTDRHGRGHEMSLMGWRMLNDYEISLHTKENSYVLSDLRRKAQIHHAEYMVCLARNEQLPYPWQD